MTHGFTTVSSTWSSTGTYVIYGSTVGFGAAGMVTLHIPVLYILYTSSIVLLYKYTFSAGTAFFFEGFDAAGICVSP